MRTEAVPKDPPAAQGGKKKKKGKGTEGSQQTQPHSLLQTAIPEGVNLERIRENGVVISRAYEGDQHVKIQSQMGMMGSPDDRDEIDVENMNIPACLTITRLDKPPASYAGQVGK